MQNIYKFINEDGKEEHVQLERWTWSVLFDDKTEFNQFDDKGCFHQFQEIGQTGKKVILFAMRSTDGLRRVDIHVTESMKLVHFYRNIGKLAAGATQKHNSTKIKVYVFGWEDTKTKTCTFNYILPNDTVVCTNTKELPIAFLSGNNK